MNTLKTMPAVFAVGDTYQIMVPVREETLMWVRVGDKCFYDHSNGIMRSQVAVHRMSVPQELLDNAMTYTICYRRIIERKPYFTETEEIYEEKFPFRPVSGEKVLAYHIADSHNMVEQPVNAAKTFENEYGKIDFLILNGDVPDHSGSLENFDTIYEIAADITKGEIPVIFSRGNHDTRGIYAEKIAECTPCLNGNSYFSFHIGAIWGIVLDCGEDKDDEHEEYGHTVCCHAFREEESEYLKTVAESGEYNANDIDYKLAIAHNPFTHQLKSPFDIEKNIYSEWAKILKEQIKPDVMICGHLHKLSVNKPGSDFDHLGQPCTVVVGSTIKVDENYYAGTGFIFENKKITAVFTDNKGSIVGINEI